MVNYYFVTGVYDTVTLCIPEDVFHEHFTVEGRYAKHKWYGQRFNSLCEESLDNMWEEFLERHRMDSKTSLVSYGSWSSDDKLLDIYEWDY